MSILSNLKTQDDIQEEKDILGGFQPLETGVYPGKIKQAFVGESKGGAASVTIHFETEESKEFRTTIYVTSGKGKGQKNYYETKDGKRAYLPGFNIFNAICLLTVSKEPSEMELEDKVINLYDVEEGKEIPTKVPMLVELLDQEVKFGIEKQIVDKNIKNDNGEYVPSGETREINEIAKVFRYKDDMTVAEIRAEAEEAVFMEQWREKNVGNVKNKAKGANSNNSGTAGVPNTGNSNAPKKPAKSLFT